MNCPVCNLRMVLRINCDAAECPDHGVMTGLRLMEIGDKRGWEALIEIRADQAMRDIWLLADAPRSEMFRSRA